MGRTAKEYFFPISLSEMHEKSVPKAVTPVQHGLPASPVDRVRPVLDLIDDLRKTGIQKPFPFHRSPLWGTRAQTS